MGERAGASASPGLVIGLVGELGAGKTQWVRGFAQGLGITERVHSPTFNLVNEYRSGRLPCFHLDLYRLETAEQVFSAGLEEYLNPVHGVSVIEWFDRLEDRVDFFANLRVVRIGSQSGVTRIERTISYEDPRT
jgi:tRNA threonylcarbamoyladenosine biosynthesis protein TsaE